MVEQKVQEPARELATEDKELEDLTEEELTELAEALTVDPRITSGSAPQMKERQDIMNFFNKVLSTDDTTKVSNLSDEELSAIRLMQRAALYALEVDYLLVAKYIKKRAEIVLATALSGKDKGGFFLRLINTQKRLLESTTRRASIPPSSGGGGRGWFKKKG